MNDHKRGCQGREYTCTCGYDDERDALIENWRDEMAAISSYLGAGLGDDQSTAEDLGKRIRWGIDNHVSSAIRLAAGIVETASKEPSRATFGAIRSRILALSPVKQEITQ